ncbi:MAG: DUF1385 domain-containing protein [Anaerolineaceae bacterium]|jgi:uncharacterized protein YqhQ
MPIERFPSYGGQALIEGVLMRGSNYLAAAFRKPDGEIEILSEKLNGIYNSRLKKIPFLRGLIMLWDALVLGTRFLTTSANYQTGENEKIEGPTLYLSLGGALLIGIAIFFLLPAAIGQGFESLLRINHWWSNLIEGIIRLVLLVSYIWLIGKMPDIQRVFAYHGAEHKVINAFESGADLTPENVMKYSIEHPRCGTSFLLTVVLLSVVVFSLLGPLPILWRFLSRIILIPILATLAYEYIRWTARHLDSDIVKFLIRPNLALQHLTTREPSRAMVEVSISAFNKMYSLELDLPQTP